MAHAAKLASLTDDLISALTASAPDKDARNFRHLKDHALKTFRAQQHLRVNQFEIDARLQGLLEKFHVLNNEPLADALKPRLDELLTIPNKWRPELLALLLALSDRPVEKTDINKALEIVPEELVQELTWADIIAQDPLTEEGIWDDIEYESDYSEHRPPSLSDDSADEPTISTNASSLAEQDTVTFARTFIIPKDPHALDQVKSLRHHMTSRRPRAQLTELQVTRQVLSMLHGLPTDLFGLGSSGRVQVKSSCELLNVAPSTLEKVLQDCALLGSQILSIRQFVASTHQCIILQSFQAAVHNRLRELASAILDIEQSLISPESSTVVSLIGIYAQINSAAVPLIRLLDHIPDSTLKPNTQAIQLLDSLSEHTSNLFLIGEDAEGLNTARLLFACLDSYLRPIKLWMTEGRLIASNELFFVQSGSEDFDRGCIWQTRFKLVTNTDGTVFAPKFMQGIAGKIFRAGKSVMFLEALGHNTEANKAAHPLDYTQILRSMENTLLPFSEVFLLALKKWIDVLEGSGSITLRRILMSQCGLKKTITAIEHLFFALNGAHFQTFAYSLFQRMDRGGGWDDRFLLTELAQTAFENVDAIDPDHITVRVNPRTTESRSTRQRRPDVLSSIVLEYSITWALQNILTRETLTVCQQAFTILLRLHRTQYLLIQQEWTLSIMASHAKEQRVKELLALRQCLNWFATTIRGYVCEMLSIASQKLASDLDSATDVDGMVASFDTFRLDLMSKLLLQDNLAPIQGSLLDILELFEDLALEWRDAIKQISNNSSRPTPRQLIVQQVHSTRQKRHEADDDAALTDDDDEEAVTTKQNARSILSVPSLLKEYKRQLSFLLAGLRGVSRIEGEAAWIMLSERLQWGS